MTNTSIKNIPQKPFKETLASYVIGFVTSIVLTLVAYMLVVDRTSMPALATLAPWTVVFVIAVLALAQFVVQLAFFMHLRVRARAGEHWKLFVLSFMIMVVLILVGGSLWIMYSLNGRMMMTPDQVQTYMQDQDGI